MILKYYLLIVLFVTYNQMLFVTFEVCQIDILDCHWFNYRDQVLGLDFVPYKK